MSKKDSTVYIVDDDPAIRESLCWLIESAGLKAASFDSADAFLGACTANSRGCLLLDVRMPGINGLELHAELKNRAIDLPVIMITGHGDVPMAVRAMRAGALDFLEKPFNDQTLLDRVQQALDLDTQARKRHAELAHIAQRLATLSQRERQVMDMVVEGRPNRLIAGALNLSEKTVESHRANLMRKMKAQNVAELVRLALTCPAGSASTGQ